MVSTAKRLVKGTEYSYLEHSIRVGKKVRKISQYLGPSNSVTKYLIRDSIRKFEIEIDEKELALRFSLLKERVDRLEYPLTWDEAHKIEKMNLQFRRIMQRFNDKDIDDLYKRFIANYVFESNALEGNSLTLKNVVEVVFEKRISSGKELREIYDAQNSYALFRYLLKARKKLSHDFIIDLHTRLMKNIDDRLGYRKTPIFLLGNFKSKLSDPENVASDMGVLLRWYEDNKDILHPLELACKFHAKFEKIHPFSDGNGRVGRFLMNYILLKQGYFPIIFRKNKRTQYLKALGAADQEKWVVLMRFALRQYKDTFKKFFAVYNDYIC